MSHKNILIIEDDKALTDILAKSLIADNLSTHIAYTVRQAKPLMKKILFDLIFLDLMLPGEDGFSFLKKIKKNPAYRHIPIIVLTNKKDFSDMDKAKKLGATDFVIKANIDYKDMKTIASRYLSTI